MFHRNTSGNSKESKLINSSRDTTVDKAVFPDIISFIQFAAQHFVAWTLREDGKVPLDPPSLPVSSIADVYVRSMLRSRVGYPLYEPNPFSQLSKEYSYNGVNIGDVGFIRQDGAFDFLFNICSLQNDAINPPNLPDGFHLETSEHSKIRITKPLSRAARLFPPAVTRTISGEYICEESEGAILELPEGAIQEEAINPKAFEDLAKLHGVEWYKYAMTQGRNISNGSMYLVTSFTKCNQWGIAIFDRRCEPGEGLSFVSSPLGWESSGSFTTKVADSNQGDTPNQCVFLRGYKIMIRQDIFDNLPAQQPAQRINGGGGSDFISKILTGGNPLTPSTAKKSDEAVLHANFNSYPVHPSDPINAALLSQNPDAKVALTHDDVWCDLLPDNFPKLDYTTLRNIAQSYRSTIDECGCVSLVKIPDSSNVLDEGSSPVRGTETPALQESKAGSGHKTTTKLPSIPVERMQTNVPQRASSFRKAVAKIKNLVSRPSHSRMSSRGLSERVKSQRNLPALDTAGKLNIGDKDRSTEIKNDIVNPPDQPIGSEAAKTSKDDKSVNLPTAFKDTIQATKHRVQVMRTIGEGVKRVSMHDTQSENDRAKTEEYRISEDSKLGYDQLIEELKRQNAEQRELLESWRVDFAKHQEETINAIRQTAQEQVPFNVQGYLDEFSRALATEVRMLLGEIGRLREERRALHHEIGFLLTLKSKYGPGGEFEPEWKPGMLPGGPGGPPGPGNGPPPDQQPPAPVQPPPELGLDWGTIPNRWKNNGVPPAGPAANLQNQVQSWATWQPNTSYMSPSPSIEPNLVVPPRGSPGLFGPRSRSPSPGLFGPRSRSPSPGISSPRCRPPSPGLFGPRSRSPSPGLFGQRNRPPSPGLSGPRSPHSSSHVN